MNKSASRNIFNDLSNIDDHRPRSQKRDTSRPSLRQAEKKLKKREITPSRNLDVKSGLVVGDGDRYCSLMNDEQLGIAQHLLRSQTDNDTEVGLRFSLTFVVIGHVVLMLFANAGVGYVCRRSACQSGCLG